MIEEKNVIRMRVPFPDIDSNLAAQPHMYVCMKSGTQKEFLKCQSFKPKHLINNKPPYNYVIEIPDINRNPFNNKTTIDCDKSFYIENIIVDRELLATKRKDICEALFADIKTGIKHKQFSRNNIDIAPLLSLNRKIKSRV